ncbi:hypothetical protein CVD28_02330 [Bacillus sp. M6-12]|uniref:hypothetical protein n=1 Tax=Bacillus sp. M6-12 TaxID=2054166 RepID=UPI000C763318|nr:hypothetical protein [Bacillus sp. M6-12]PLS19270.1 hypothetical protein CVD28_02330 [Bacillus sp. M6-12]
METLSFIENDIWILFNPDDSRYLIRLEDHKSLACTLKISVQKKRDDEWKPLGTYYHSWSNEEKFNHHTYHVFVKKFLESEEFRANLEQNGEKWAGTIPYRNEKGVSLKCADKIQELNNKKTYKFKDFAELKTYGFDKYSRMNLETLIEILPESSFKAIQEAFPDDKEILLRTLRWNARGLRTDLAIRKVKTDIEIAINANQVPLS